MARSQVTALQVDLTRQQAETRAARDEVELLCRRVRCFFKIFDHSCEIYSPVSDCCVQLAGLKDSADATAAALSSQLASRDAEVSRLQQQLIARAADTSATRMADLTEQLRQRQTALDAAQGERRVLQQQVDALQRQVQALRDEGRDVVLSIPGGDDEPTTPRSESGSALPEPVLSQRGMKAALRRAASVADRVSLRAAVLLRRYPKLRVGLVVYAVLLHVWVFSVLLASTPALPQ